MIVRIVKVFCIGINIAMLVSMLLGCSTAKTISPKNSGAKVTSAQAVATKEPKEPTPTKVNESTNENLNSSEQLVYENKRFGFTLTFPFSWKGKYLIEENDYGISVNYNTEVGRKKNIEFFGIGVSKKSGWKDNTNAPVEKICEKDDKVYYAWFPTQAGFNMNLENEKKEADEFSYLDNSTESVIKSFKLIDTINDFHPIVFLPVSKSEGSDEAYVLGGSKDGKWYKISDFILPGNSSEEINIDTDLVKGGETYKFYSPKKVLATATGEKPTYRRSPANGEQLLKVKLGHLDINEDYVFGVNGSWDALPRVSKEIEKDVYSVDLDNDGKDEILKISESPINDKNYKNAKDVKFTILSAGKSVLAGQTFLDGTYASKYRVFPLDLNGDGRLELVTLTVGHNMSITIEQFVNGEISEVFRFYDGD